MKLRTKQKTTPDCQENIAEITKILLNGICRLEAKEKTEHSQILLDNKTFPSTHSTSNINNQNHIRL